ncbi:hypothetical protein [Cesiribacter sp. SM1]|uniref:hypothetical protein n=1 Tax=Cesiribacter sp. SM1 TaxID=2861196 RepID=UPI001CD53AC6|nr:hypothetical protein [Cesiribacter sp. SM1]
MNNRLLIVEPYTEVSYDEQNRVIITKWKGSLELEQVRSTLEFKANFIREHGIRYNLNDHSELKVLLPEVQQYLIEEGHPLLERVGLRKIAVKLAKDIFAQATVRKVNRVENYDRLQIEVFSNYEDAYAWLLSDL